MKKYVNSLRRKKKVIKKKMKKLFFCGKNRVNPLTQKKNVIKIKTKKLFSVENNSNSLRKETKRTGKTQIAFQGHAPGFCSARENACPTEGSLL
jgi:hypothetical protein